MACQGILLQDQETAMSRYARQLIAFAATLHLASLGANAGIDYDRDIRPLLSDTCYACHGPDDAERKADLRLHTRDGLLGEIRASEPLESELYQRISSNDPDERMPPPEFARSLTSKQIETIRRWIEEGANWKGHWAFERVERPDAPEVKQTEWVKNPIDRFVLARLESEGLMPSPPAQDSVLARRLWFDLTGLPPTSAEVARFAQTREMAATAKRLFRRPTYAERMTSRWLDAARYADTSGYQTDGWRTMWRWRDWVIDSFRRNQRFDQFTLEQLAGDLLPNATLEQKIATGFNRNHRGNSEGGIVQEEFLVEYAVDRVDTTFTVWQGVTIGCARCHSHKYDPFTHRDYYQLFAFFNRLHEKGRVFKEGNSAPWIVAPTRAQARKLKQLKKTEAAARSRFEEGSRNLPEQIHAWEQRREHTPTWLDYESLVASSAQTNGAVAKFGYFDRFTLSAQIKIKAGDQGTILSKKNPAKQGLGYSLDLTKDGKVQLNLIKRWLDDALRVETVEPVSSGHVLVTYNGSRKSSGIQFFVNGERVEHKANLDYMNQTFETDEPLLVGKGNADFTGEVETIAVFDRVLDEIEIRAVAEPSPIATILAQPERQRSALEKSKLEQYFLRQAGPDELRRAHAKWLAAKRIRAAFKRDLPSVMIMEDRNEQPTHILLRGQYDQPGERVFANVPASLPAMPKNAPRNRLGLAHWLVSRENPLTARVTINRLWRDIFGTGLVKTTEDFGVQGERPSHPALLDWLAAEFMESGWDIQHMLTLIVSSSTYQQSSRSTPELNRRDPENRLLARGPRFRLPAEMIRDQALAISGLLHRTVGGPSVKSYQPAGLWADIASVGNYELGEGTDLYRRSLYSYWKRTVPPPMMMNFDSASRESCEVGMKRTNTPMQALNLMNDETFVEASRVLAQSILQATKHKRLTTAFLRVLQRKPNARESGVLERSLATHLAKYRAAPEAADDLLSVGQAALPDGIDRAELAAWTMICSTLMNLDETVTKE
ncbi:MAG: hypothetical protein CMO80_02345 [Verrucomicrobiales bacterium]|nr:hypothetical protein [Verrucomicrobiales bacterium]